MKLFRTVSSDVIKECRCFFGITDTKLLIVKRKMKFLRKYCSSENGLCKLFALAASLERKMLAIYWVVTFLHNYFVSAFICLFACLSFIICCLLLVNKVAYITWRKNAVELPGRRDQEDSCLARMTQHSPAARRPLLHCDWQIVACTVADAHNLPITVSLRCCGNLLHIESTSC